MLSPRLQAIGWSLHLAGVAIAAAASVLGHTQCATVAAVLIAAGVLLFGMNALLIASHLLRRPSTTQPPVSVDPAPVSV